MQPQVALEAISPLLDALLDASPRVRQAALHAVVRLPLDWHAWAALGELIRSWLDAGSAKPGFDDLSVDGLSFWEILAAALYLPDPDIRRVIRDLLENEKLPPSQRARLEGMLIQAGDEATLREVVQRLDPRRARAWREIAPLLYRLPYPVDLAPAQRTFDASADPELRFWCALALARWGQPQHLRALFTAAGDTAPLPLEKAWPVFGPFSSRLHPFPPFPSDIQDDLYGWYTKTPGSDSSRLAGLLLHAGLPADQAAAISIEPPTFHPAAAWRRSAGQPDEPLANLAKNAPIDPDPGLLEILPRLDHDQANRLVSLGFAGALNKILKRNSAEASKPGDAYGCYPAEAVLRLGENYQPDIGALFECFIGVRAVAASRQGKLPDQVAWAASRAAGKADSTAGAVAGSVFETRGEPAGETGSETGIAAVLAAVGGELYAPQESRRLAAADFIELANLYAPQEQPPGMHGLRPATFGAPLSEIPPPVIVEFEQAAIGGEMSAAGGALGMDMTGLLDFSIEMAPPQTPVINTGWAPGSDPGQPLLPVMPLQTDTDYFFWLNVDLPSIFSGEMTPVGIQTEIAAGSILTVALVGYQGSFQIDPQACIGELEVLPNGYAKVNRQPLGPAAPHTDAAHITLYFPVHSPAKPASHRLRCNIYSGQILLQSRLATARVVAQPKPARPAAPAWRTDLDFHLASPLLAARLSSLPSHKLSLQVNANGDGSHSFHLKGAADGRDFKQDDVRFTEGEMQTMISQARQALQIASWDKPDDWQKGQPFKYQDRQRNLERLRLDLVRLARWGYEFYFTIAERLAGGSDSFEQFQELMKASGYVQVAMKSSPGFILPAALIYDYPLDTSSSSPYKLCQTFQDALLQNRSLVNEPCFNGDCPERGDDTTVCPGGFWGFRHYLGLPLSLDGGADAALQIPYTGKPRFLMGEFVDFKLVAQHKDRLDDLALDFSSDADRDQLLARMKQHASELIYFYCHGGLVRGLPFLVVGSEAQKGQIQPSNFLAKQIRWKTDPHPLVFLNGCHTSAVDPLAALSLLRGFVIQAQAAGLIGTEITIYEELASDFAEAFFSRLLNGQPVGQALREARLVILAQGNPLGLVYTPFVQAGLRLEKSTATPPASPVDSTTGLGMGLNLDPLDPASPFGM